MDAKNDSREPMVHRRCGNSGLKLPLISLGFWQNFGASADPATTRALILGAFDHGITHFDLANNYGPPPGTAEQTLGRVLREDLHAHRDDLVIATKAGYVMRPGPHGTGGSRKHLIASLDRSLERLGLEYTDIFYHHRPDPDTPLEETMGALDSIVRSGRALYVGISSYSPAQTEEAAAILKSLGTPCLAHQARYSMFDRRIESGLLDVLDAAGIGCVAFSTLEQGLLTDRYVENVPADSRAANPRSFFKREQITPEAMHKVGRLRDIARERDQSTAQLALAWALRDARVTSALVGASRLEQITQAAAAHESTTFTAEELRKIEEILGKPAQS